MDAQLSKQNLLAWDGDVIDGYTVEEILIGGGKTTYFQVKDAMDSRLALKLPTRDALNAQLRSRFQREVEILKLLSGPHFPRLVAHGTFDMADVKDVPYIVTDLPLGQTLDRLLAQNRARQYKPTEQSAVRLLRNLAWALKELNERGIVHRNIRPQRVAVTQDYDIQILDFVLGRGATVTHEELTKAASGVLGSHLYVAPEQMVDPSSVDGRADLFSVGVLIYEFLSQSSPFTSGGDWTTVMSRLTDEVPSLSNWRADISVRMDTLIGRLLKRNPSERYDDASALLAEIDKLYPEG